MHLRRAVAVAVALGAIGVSAANAFAADQTPLTGQITPALSTISASSPVAGRYIVTFSGAVSESEQSAALADAGTSDVSTIPALRMHVIDASDAAVSALRANPAVDGVEADQVRNVQAAPSDPGYSSQWSLSRIGWDQAFGSVNPTGSATVAVLDTGIDASHPDLAGQLAPGTSIVDPTSDGTTDPNGHGTWMAGIVAAGTDNAMGIAGIGYSGVKVMPVAVLGADGTGSDGDIISGVIYAADHGANVILMSFTNPAFSQSLQDAIDYAWSKGAVVVAAAGNDESATVNYPAGDRGVVGVANTDESDALNATSNYGQAVFMAAPGTNIYTTSAGGGYATITGTSASAAEVAGAAALMKANSSDASNGVIVGRLGADAEALSGGQQAGNGRLNLARAINDSSTSSIEPAGSAPIGEGGPVVGPYVVAAKSLAITIAGAGSVALADETDSANNKTCASNCSVSTGNNDKGTLTASPAASSTFAGWSGQSGGVTLCTEAAGEGTCKFSMGNSAQNVTATFTKAAADGSGSSAVSPTSAVAGSAGNTLTFKYTAAAGGLNNGALQLTVPSGWSAPSTTSGTKGYSTSSAGTVAASGQNITVSGLTLAGGATVTITYGDKTGGGAGADAPGAGSSGTSTFTTSEKSTNTGTLAALATSPSVTVTNSANGSGSMVVSPTAAVAASGGNTLTFTYTAVAGGLNNGALQLSVPSGWSAPSTTSSSKAYTTSSVGTVEAAGQTITVSGLTLSANATVTITYGDRTGGGAGADAPGVGTSTFNTSEKSTSGGTLTALASSPSVQVTAPTVSTTFPTNSAAYNATGWAAGCATAGLCGTAGDTGSTISGVQVSIKRNSDNSYWSGTSFVAGSETYLAASGTTSWGSALAASALSDGLSYTVHAKSTDKVGNVSSVANTTFTYDTTAPSPTVSTPTNNSNINKSTPTISGAAGTATGDNTTVTVKIYNGTGTGGSVAQTFNGVAVTSGSWSVIAAALSQGTYTAQVTQGDSAGNSGSATSTFTVDTTAPVTTDDVPSVYVNHDVTVTLTAGDTGGSGVDKTYYTTDGSTPTTSSPVYNPASKPVLTSDGQVIKYFSTDKAGNAESAHIATAHIDRSAPTTSDDVPSAYVNHNVTVTLTATDTGGSGLDKTYYTTDGSTPTTASSVYNPASKPVLTSDGQSIRYFSTDKAGNEETPHSATAHIDTLAPSTSAAGENADASVYHSGDWTHQAVTVTLSATDAPQLGSEASSGVDKTFYKVDSATSYSTGTSVTIEAPGDHSNDGTHTITYYSTDKAGNTETTHTFTIKTDTAAPSSGATSAQFDNTGTIAIDARATDASPSSGVSSVELYVKKPGDSTFTLAHTNTDGSSNFNYTVPLDESKQPTNGSYSFYTIAHDTAGNNETAKTTADTTTLEDTVAPSSGATSSQFDNSGTIAVDAHAADGAPSSGVSSVDLYVEKPGDSAFTLAHINSDGSSSFNYTVPLDGSSKPVNGDYGFYTIAHDTAGNVEAAKSSAETTTLEDTVKPGSQASAPATNNAASIDVSYSAADQSPSSGLGSVELWVKVPNGSGYTKAATDSTPGASGSFTYTVPSFGEATVDGTYSFYTISTDGAGNRESVPGAPDATTTESNTIQDTLAPVTTAAGANADASVYGSGVWTRQAVTVTLTASDPPQLGADASSGVDHTYYKLDSAVSYATGTVLTIDAPGDHSNDGTHIVSYYSTDKAGNTESTHTFTVKIDTQTPSSGATSGQFDNSGTIAVDAHAVDPSPSSGLSSVELYVKKPGDSTFTLAHTNTDGSSTFNYTVPLDTGKQPVNGSYSFYTIAHDGAGNNETAKTTAETTTLEDTVAPGSGATSSKFDNSGTIAVDAHAVDPSPASGVSSVDLYVEKPGDSSFSLAHTNSDGSSSFNYTVPLDGAGKAVNGSYGFYTIAHDGAGNAEAAKSSAETTTLEDTVKPGSQASAPTTNNQPTISVSYTAADHSPSSGLASVELWVKVPNGSGYSKTATDSTPGANGSFTYTVPTSAGASVDGTYSFYTISTDQAGNRESVPGTPDATTTESNTIQDTQPPTTTAAGKNADASVYESGAWTHQAVTVTLTATDPPQPDADTSSGVEHTFYKVDSAASYSTGTTITVPAPGDHSNDGTHTITYYSTDKASNTETTHTFAIKLDTVAPGSGATSGQFDNTGTIAIDAHATDPSPSSGVSSVELYVKKPGDSTFTLTHTNTDGSSTFSYQVSLDTSKQPVNGDYSVYTIVHDGAGNSEAAKTTAETTTLEDTIAPATTDEVPAAYVNHDVTVTLSATDTGGSGVDKTYYTTDGSEPSISSSVYNPASKPVLTSDGQVVKYFSADKAGNEETTHTATAHIDRAAPTTSDDVPSSYVNHDVTVTLTAGDTGGSGADKTYYTTDGSEPTTSSPVYNPASKPILTSDGQKIAYFSTDKAGNAETPHSATAHIDTLAPTTTAAAAQNADASVYVSGAWTHQAVTITLTASDPPQLGAEANSGVDKTFYKVDSATSYSTGTSVTIDAPGDHSNDGTHTISYYSTDKAGNTEATHTFTVKIDTQPPTSGATSAQFDNTGTIAVDAHASDPSPSSGVSSVELYVKKPGDSGFTLAHTNTNGSSSFNYTVPLDEGKQPINGSYSFYTIAHDTAGNNEAAKTTGESTTLEDTIAPTTTDDMPVGYVNHDVTVTLTTSDTGGSGIDKTYYTTDGSTPTISSPVYNSASKPVLTSDGQKITYFSTDKAGNAETPHSATAHIQTDVTPPTTTDNVDANWHASPVSVTLTATDNVGGSGVKTTSFKVYGGSTVPAKTDSGWQTYDQTNKPTLNNGQAIAYYSVDNAGNQENVVHSAVAKVDSVTGVSNGATYTLGSVPAVSCIDSSATVSSSGKVGQVTATCTDGGGTVNITYTVAYCATNLGSPVSGSWVSSTGACTTAAPSTAVYNVAKGGSSVPIKFSLHGNQGLAIFAPGYPLSQQIIATGSYTDSTITVTTNASGLTYDAASDQYTYVWSTNKAWSGENRQLVLELSDGVTYIRANFYLK